MMICGCYSIRYVFKFLGTRNFELIVNTSTPPCQVSLNSRSRCHRPAVVDREFVHVSYYFKSETLDKKNRKLTNCTLEAGTPVQSSRNLTWKLAASRDGHAVDSQIRQVRGCRKSLFSCGPVDVVNNDSGAN